MFKKLSYKLLPYIVALCTGFFIYYFAVEQNGEIKDLLINISAAFFAIPLIYLFYEIIKFFFHKKLRKEIFDYIKMQIDREVLSILNQLQKTIFPLGEKRPFSNKVVNDTLSLNSREIQGIIKSNKYLGFKILKNWEIPLKNLEELLKNSLVVSGLEDDQMISIIKLFKSIRSFEDFQRINDLYRNTGEKTSEYKIVNGMKINTENRVFPDRYLLLKSLENNKFVVEDFGDIAKYNLENCLFLYKINENLTEFYSVEVANILKNINDWLKLTGEEFVVDTRIFRLTHVPQI
ncbi:MAG: hypothetical protein AAB877_02450 [Patescibacteria group bacterium]